MFEKMIASKRNLTLVASAAPTGGEISSPVDRARLIQRSLRCFMFGLIGMIPFAGSILGYVALRLHRRILDDTGELWSVRPILWLQAFGLVLSVPATKGLGLLGWCLTAGAVLAAQGWLLWRQFRNGAGREWNPARGHIYLGVAAALTGIFVTLALIALGIGLVAQDRW